MFVLKDIVEIKKKLIHAKLALWQGLHDLMYLDDIDLMEVREITIDQAKILRKKAEKARAIVG